MKEIKGGGEPLCVVPLGNRGSTTRKSKDDMECDYKCQQDQAKSMRVCHAVQGTKITVYNNANMNENSGTHLDITVKLDLGSSCAIVPSFDDVAKDYEDNEYFIYYRRRVGNGKLNRKISSFVITVPK